jgi:hypothetical protein
MDHVFEINSSITRTGNIKTGELNSIRSCTVYDRPCADCDEWTCVTCDNEPGGTCNLDPGKPIRCAVQESKCNDCEEVICVLCDNEPSP